MGRAALSISFILHFFEIHIPERSYRELIFSPVGDRAFYLVPPRSDSPLLQAGESPRCADAFSGTAIGYSFEGAGGRK